MSGIHILFLWIFIYLMGLNYISITANGFLVYNPHDVILKTHFEQIQIN